MLIALTSVAYAQIDPVVEVNRNYETKLTDVRKPFVAVSLPDSLQNFNMGFDYSIFSRPYSDLYDFSPKQVAALNVKSTPSFPHIFAELGAQYPLIPRANVYFQAVPSENVNIDAFARYNAFFGKILNFDDTQNDASGNHGEVGAKVKFAWNMGEFDFGLGYNLNNTQNKVGEAMSRHNAGTFKMNVALTSANPDKKGFYYKVDASYRNTGGNHELPELADGDVPGIPYRSVFLQEDSYRENVLAVSANVGSSFEEHRIYLDVLTKNCWYDKDKMVGVVEFTPIYQYEKGIVDAKIGIKFSSRYGHSESSRIYPYFDAKFALVKNALWLRAQAFGGSNVETLNDNIDSAPWMRMAYRTDKEDIPFSETIVDAKVSVETMLFKRLSLSLFASYAKYVDKMQLWPLYKDIVVLHPEYVDYSKFAVGAELSFASKNFGLIGSFKYNTYKSDSGSPLVLLPKVEALVKADYNIHSRLMLSAYFHFRSGMDFFSDKTYGSTVPAYKDLGFKVDYSLSSGFSVFLKGGNVLGSKNFRYAFIGEPPRNFGAGICFRL